MAKLDQIEIDGTLYEVVPEIAPLFSTLTAYAAGDCVIKDAVLYRFKTAHAAGAWIGTDADAIEVGKELTGLKQDLNLSDTLIFTRGIINNQGVIGTGSDYITNNLNYAVNPIKLVCLSTPTTGAQVLYYTKNDTFIVRSNYVTKEYTIPKGSYFRICVANADKDKIKIIEDNSEYNWTYSTTNGTNYLSYTNNRVATASLIKIKNPMFLSVSDYSRYKINVHIFSVDDVGRATTTLKEIRQQGWNQRETIINDIGSYLCILLAYVDDSPIDDINDVVSAFSIREGDLSMINKLPYYWQNHITNRINTINSYCRDNAYQSAFMFITDTHIRSYDGNMMHSHDLMKTIATNTPIKLIINGGDVAKGIVGDSADDRLSVNNFLDNIIAGINYCGADIENATMMSVVGNHDTGVDYLGNERYGEIITNEQLFSQLKIPKQVTYNSDTKFEYFWDDTSNKVRYIVTCAGLATELGLSVTEYDLFAWLGDVLNSTPSGYHIIVFNHVFYNSGGTTVNGAMQNSLNLCGKYNERESYTYGEVTVDCSNGEGVVRGVFCGHSHIDANYRHGAGINVIMTTTDNASAELGETEREIGTIEEQAFDCMIVSNTHKLISAYRVGFGSDRTFVMV